jgi:hypothetical protein
MRALALVLWALAGCGASAEGAKDGAGPADGPVPAECDAEGGQRVGLVTSLRFARADAGQSEGFDLDGLQTLDGASDAGCGIADYTDAAGNPGVDNAFARLIPALELTEAAAVEGLIAAAISSGELLILIEMDELDSLTDDTCVDFAVSRALGAPDLGPDNLPVSGQTFDRDPAVAPVRVADAALVGGTIEARPLTITLPVDILNASLEFVAEDGAFRAIWAEDGSFTGHMAGAIDIAALIEVALIENVDPALAGVLETLLYGAADLAPGADGRCTKISITFEVQGVSAFVFADPAPAGADTGADSGGPED